MFTQASTLKSIALLKKEVWTWETISTWNLKSGKIEKYSQKWIAGYISKPQNSLPPEGAVQKKIVTKEDFEEEKKITEEQKQNEMKKEKQKKENVDVNLHP